MRRLFEAQIAVLGGVLLMVRTNGRTDSLFEMRGRIQRKKEEKPEGKDKEKRENHLEAICPSFVRRPVRTSAPFFPL